jgi:hypothetical protein
LIRSEELHKGLNHEHYRDSYLNLCGTLEQLPSLDLSPEEREQAQRVLQTLYLWAISLPDNFREGLTASDIAEAAWLADDAVGSTAQAEHLLSRLVQAGFPLRVERKARDSKEVDLISYELSATQTQPVKIFAPLKKKAKEDLTAQNAKWQEALFWQLPDITEEAQRELGVNDGAARPEVDGLRKKLLGLGLAHAAEALAEELSDAVKHDRPAHGVLDRLLGREVSARDERRVKTSLELSNLPPGMTLGNFDFGFQPSIERRQIETLATCAFIREHATLLVQGPPGVGKTHLVVALGVRAIEQGFRVAFYRLEELLHEMRQDAAVSPQALRRRWSSCASTCWATTTSSWLTCSSRPCRGPTTWRRDRSARRWWPARRAGATRR